MSMFPTNTTNVLTLGCSTQSQQKEESLPAQLLQLQPDLCSLAQLEQIFCLASLGDGPLQRLAKIMVEGLVRRRLGTINRALIHPYCQRSVRTARCSFIKLLPFLKMAYVAINRVILDDMENEKFVHIIDLSGPAAHWWQWVKLMRALRQRPEGPPADLRITMVHDDGEFLAAASARLRKEAESLDMAFTFHGFLCRRLETLLDLGADDLHAALAIKCGYARALSCALQMRRLLEVDATATWPPGASSSSFVHAARETTTMKTMNLRRLDPSPTTPLSPFLSPPPSPPPLLTRFLTALDLKVLAVAEHEASHNHNHDAPDFTARFRELLHYYAALFDALEDDASSPGGAERHHHHHHQMQKQQQQEEEERAQVEQVVLGEEIRDALVRGAAAEPLFREWAARMEEGAGFGPVPLSWVAKMEADEVLRKRRVRRYENRGREHGGVPENCLLLCRSGRPLYAVSAWRPRSAAASEASVVGGGQQQRVVVVPLPAQILPSTWTSWAQPQADPVHNFTC
ncbi:hypothetical protein QOZ80_5AG0380790 [Eleusine coracana subsp. coracana]|nr:hypothetical protein QOZ80_5AG0380790 [Eleusine coracana subsp. coracana]